MKKLQYNFFLLNVTVFSIIFTRLKFTFSSFSANILRKVIKTDILTFAKSTKRAKKYQK